MQAQRRQLESTQAFVAAKVAEICEIIAHDTQPLALTKDVRYSTSTAPASALPSALQVLSLRERMFSFLRVADLHVGESIFRHLVTFMSDLLKLVCGEGDEVTLPHPSSETPSVRQASSSAARPETKTLAAPVAKLELSDSASEQCEAHEFRVRYRLKGDEALFPILYARLENGVDLHSQAFVSEPSAFQLAIVPSKIDVLEMLHRLIGDYMAAMDSSPIVVRLAACPPPRVVLTDCALVLTHHCGMSYSTHSR